MTRERKCYVPVLYVPREEGDWAFKFVTSWCIHGVHESLAYYRCKKVPVIACHVCIDQVSTYSTTCRDS